MRRVVINLARISTGLSSIVITLVVALVGLLRALLPSNQTAQSVWYLMKVGQGDHTFDNSLFRKDFGAEVAKQEETILECFKRIRRRHPRETWEETLVDFGLIGTAKKPKRKLPNTMGGSGGRGSSSNPVAQVFDFVFQPERGDGGL